MVGVLKKWLGIDALERENKAFSDEILALARQIKHLSEASADAFERTDRRINDLTPEPVKPKIVVKPRPVTWGN